MRQNRKRQFRLGLGPPILFALLCIVSAFISIRVNTHIHEKELRGRGAVGVNLH